MNTYNKPDESKGFTKLNTILTILVASTIFGLPVINENVLKNELNEMLNDDTIDKKDVLNYLIKEGKYIISTNGVESFLSTTNIHQNDFLTELKTYYINPTISKEDVINKTVYNLDHELEGYYNKLQTLLSSLGTEIDLAKITIEDTVVKYSNILDSGEKHKEK